MPSLQKLVPQLANSKAQVPQIYIRILQDVEFSSFLLYFHVPPVPCRDAECDVSFRIGNDIHADCSILIAFRPSLDVLRRLEIPPPIDRAGNIISSV